MADKLTEKKVAFLTALKSHFKGSPPSIITRSDIREVLDKHDDLGWPSWLTADKALRAGRGEFHVADLLAGNYVPTVPDRAAKAPKVEAPVADLPAPVEPVFAEPVEPTENIRSSSIRSIVSDEDYSVARDPLFVPFGQFQDLKKIFRSGLFFPIMITGESGNGKTLAVMQAAAETKREVLRVNLTRETDEDSLIGGFRLVDGDTVWFNGPVLTALERGAVLLLDEVDYSDERILALQSVMEGKGVFVKKIGRWVKAAPGFTIVATANTKGRGSESGKYVGANIMNEAFLERFILVMEWEYPTETIERKIVTRALENKLGRKADEGEKNFLTMLASWAAGIRQAFNDGAVDDQITTRRLVHATATYAVFGDALQAVRLVVNRFPDETRDLFYDYFTKVYDPGTNAESNEPFGDDDADGSADGASKKGVIPF